ncbi:MAG TPA: dihydrodipicolinate synthase family protein [Nitriliruptorales bacterium]
MTAASPASHPFPAGIVSVLQTPFDRAGEVDPASLERLVEFAIGAGVDGLLLPVVASEAERLSVDERVEVVRVAAAASAGRVPLVVGATDDDPATTQRQAALATEVGAVGYLVAAPSEAEVGADGVVAHITAACRGSQLPVLLQDLDWSGPGVSLDTVARLLDEAVPLAGVKVETSTAGAKYTALRERFGADLYVCGGWAVTQLVEALDRGVDAMIPESSMVALYRRVVDRYRAGDRDGARDAFRRMLPVLAFSNQDLPTSVAFFKRLLVRRGVFATAVTRLPAPGWDAYRERIAAELIDLVLDLEGAA